MENQFFTFSVSGRFRSISFASCFFFLVPTISEAQSVSLDTLIQRLKENNPEIKSSKYSAKAAMSRVHQVNAWEAPMIGIELDDAPVKQFPEQKMINYFVSQKIPFPGKKSFESSAAMFGKDMMEQETNSVENELILKLKFTYYDLFLHEKKIELIRENEFVLKQMSDIALRQYEVGIGRQSDILRSQTELSLEKKEEISLVNETVMFRSMINSLTNQPTDNFFTTSNISHPDTAKLNLNKLLEIADNNRPELQAAKYKIRMLEEEFNRSKREYYPDLIVGAKYKKDLDMDNDSWMLEVGLSIPIAPWSSGNVSGKVDESEMNLNRARSDFVQMRNMVANQIQSALSSIEANRQIYEMYITTILPQAEQTLTSTLSAYQTGKAEFFMVNEAHHMLIDANIAKLHAENDWLKSYAQLEQATGN